MEKNIKSLSTWEIIKLCEEFKDKNWCNRYCSILLEKRCPENKEEDCAYRSNSLNHHYDGDNWIGEMSWWFFDN